MDFEEFLFKEGMLIIHKINEGKHQYKVERVMKYNKGSAEESFARRGDKLLQVNSMNVHDVAPEELAQILTESNPKLRLHSRKDQTKEALPGEHVFYPISKESILLNFSMEMKREEDLEDNEVGQEGEGWEDEGTEEGVCSAENGKNGEGGGLVIVSFQKTSISVVRGRGCEGECACKDCDGTGCNVNDVVVVAASSRVMHVSRGSESLRQEKSSSVTVEHLESQYFLRALCSPKTISTSPNPEKITIYYYKSNSVDREFRGMPVVLNFSESNYFLRCYKKDDKVFLQVEMCDKRRLKQIAMSDESTLSFVFYMKANRSKQRTFESALYLEWFIQIIDSDIVKMATLDEETDENSFFFIIEK